MKQSPRVSIVLPCLDAAETLSAAVNSIRAQTYRDWELIVVDDGSTDASLGLARDAAAQDPRLRVMALPHVGIVEALRRGCAAAEGPLIARMDADDVAMPTRLAKQVALMEADRTVALCGTQVRMTGSRIGYGRSRYQSWINALVTYEDNARELFVECPIPHPTFMMRRDAYKALGGYTDHGWAEDYDLCMRMFAAGMRFGKVAEPLLDWTESPRRLSMVSPRYAPERFRALKRHYLFRTYLSAAFLGRSDPARQFPPLKGGRGDVAPTPDTAFKFAVTSPLPPFKGGIAEASAQSAGKRFCQWGAGEVGKAWLREWGECKPEAVVDINPRKIGRTIHGIPTIPPEDLPPPSHSFIVITVGAPNAREEIRAWLLPRGYRECRDFLFLA